MNKIPKANKEGRDMLKISHFQFTVARWYANLIMFMMIGFLLIVSISCTARSEPGATTIHTYTLNLPPVLGVVTDENLQIIYVEPGSAAEKAGLQTGDVLKEVEGIAIMEKPHLKFTRKDKDDKEGEIEVEIIPGPMYLNPAATPTAIPVTAKYF